MIRFVILLFVLSGCGDDDASMPDAAELCMSDGDCDDGVFCNGSESCSVGASGADARGCLFGFRPCLRGQRCEEADERCSAICEALSDADGDGSEAMECGGDDCDDSDPRRHPGAQEVCDVAGVDEDCNPDTLSETDADEDGEVSVLCCNGERCGADCDDRRANVRPGAVEACNRIDDDCDGNVDEDVMVEAFEDLDGDGAGDPSRPVNVCPGVGLTAATGDDCDDEDPLRRPGLPEVCDMVDNDCDGDVDEDVTMATWFRDADGDRFGSASSGTRLTCQVMPGWTLHDTDCDDGDPSIHPAAAERCDGVDTDCNGFADFEIAPGDFEDDDGDGVIDIQCEPRGRDCDDNNSTIAEGFEELCNGIDDDCDGRVDELVSERVWFRDADGDGFGSEASGAVSSCERPANHASRGGDCDDGDVRRFPAAPERCNSYDDDCDGVLDEGC